MIILMCERFWQHARDSFISSQLHTNHDVCFECFQRGEHDWVSISEGLAEDFGMRNRKGSSLKLSSKKLEESGPTSNHSGSSAEA